MNPIERDAMNIIKGEMNGDTYLWDAIFYDEEGRPQVGCWKSQLEKQGQP